MWGTSLRGARRRAVTRIACFTAGHLLSTCDERLPRAVTSGCWLPPRPPRFIADARRLSPAPRGTPRRAERLWHFRLYRPPAVGPTLAPTSIREAAHFFFEWLGGSGSDVGCSRSGTRAAGVSTDAGTAGREPATGRARSFAVFHQKSKANAPQVTKRSRHRHAAEFRGASAPHHAPARGGRKDLSPIKSAAASRPSAPGTCRRDPDSWSRTPRRSR